MVVYIDVLIVINIYISYFTLRAGAGILHIRTRPSRTAAASVFGGASALAALAELPMALSLLLKAALTVIMVLIAFGYGSFRGTALRSFICVTVGMLICGAAALIHEFARTDLVFSANGYPYIGISALVLVISSAVIYGILSLWRRFTDSPSDSERITLSITNSGNTAFLSAIPDSGNFLRDFLTGRPVILCKSSAAEPILSPNVRAYLNGDTGDMTGIRLIPMTTAAGESLAAAFRPDSLAIVSGEERKRLDALIAVSPNSLKNEDFDAVINTKLLK